VQSVMPRTVELTEDEFEAISRQVKRLAGINLHAGKKELIKARLNKRLRKLGLDSFEQYMEYIRSDATGNELVAMLDALCTNLTSFFRESEHFDYLARVVLPALAARGPDEPRRLRIWSAGCATGEEAYSIAITVREVLGDLRGWDAGILATDLSVGAVQTACRGVYPAKRVESVPPQIRARYFELVATRPERRYHVVDELRRCMCLARLNLMDAWPMRGRFDAVFCRNVMIYFDKAPQALLIERFWQVLEPGGTLFVGHSESLTGVRHRFRYVAPTIYERV